MIYPKKQKFCIACKGKRTLWSRTVAQAYNKCIDCDGKGYIILKNPENVEEFIEIPEEKIGSMLNGNTIHAEVIRDNIKKNRGRPKKS